MFILIKLNKILFAGIAAGAAVLFLAVGYIVLSHRLAINKPVKLVIMMYHEVKPQNPGKLSITPLEFESDLRYLKQNNYTTITMTDLIDYTEGIGTLPEKPVILTFDDGYQNNYTYVYPLLKEYHMKAVISIIGSDTDECSLDSKQNINVSQLTWEEINEMIDSGCAEFQNHTYDLHSITPYRAGSKRAKGESYEQYEKVLTDDLLKCQQDFQRNTGILPNTFTYPYGEISPESVPVIKKLGFKATLTTDEGVNFITKDPESLFGLKRIPRFHNVSIKESVKEWDKG